MRVTNSDNSLKIGRNEYTLLLQKLIRQFKFLNGNQIPKSIILPGLTEIKDNDGNIIPIEFEEVEEYAPRS